MKSLQGGHLPITAHWPVCAVWAQTPSLLHLVPSPSLPMQARHAILSALKAHVPYWQSARLALRTAEEQLAQPPPQPPQPPQPSPQPPQLPQLPSSSCWPFGPTSHPAVSPASSDPPTFAPTVASGISPTCSPVEAAAASGIGEQQPLHRQGDEMADEGGAIQFPIQTWID